MSRHRRGRFTVQHQPTGGERAMMRGMGVVHAVFGLVFVVIALTEIIPSAGLFGLPFLAAGTFFAVNGIRIAVSKNGFAHRVGYDVETDMEEESIVGLTEEPRSEPAEHEHSYACEHSTELSPQKRLEQLQHLRDAGLLTEGEYRDKRKEIISKL